jgi:hypothetical protein
MSSNGVDNDVALQFIRRAYKDIERAISQLDKGEIDNLVKLRGILAQMKKVEMSLR